MAAAGFAAGWGPPLTAEAQSVWDRNPQPRREPLYQTAEYRVEEPIPVDVWENFHSSWTPVDNHGHVVRPQRPEPAARPTVAQRPTGQRTPIEPRWSQHERVAQPTILPLPEAVIRSSLNTGRPAPATAASILRGAPAAVTEPAAPPTAAGFAKLVLSPAGPAPVAYPTQDVDAFRPFPIQATRHVAHEEERTYSLFGDPLGPTYDSHSTPSNAALWDRSAADTYGYALTGGEQLLAPPAADVGEPGLTVHDGEGVVMLDGLDAVAVNVDAQSPYIPVPLSQIRPYHSYSPEGATLCPDPDGRCPEIKPLPNSWDLMERNYAHLDFLWVPSNVFSSPLYFEDPALERYGHSHGPLVQPVASAVRFGAQLVSLPYQMALDPPHRRVYPLGYYRPGECAPKQVPNVPLNAKAAATAGAVYTGLIFAFP